MNKHMGREYGHTSFSFTPFEIAYNKIIFFDVPKSSLKNSIPPKIIKDTFDKFPRKLYRC